MVSDQYHLQSIKDLEKTDRAAEGEVLYTVNRRNQFIPVQFRKYLHNSNNKRELIEFLIDDWAKNINTTDILKDKECRNDIPFKEIEQELCSNQEEADTKMFLSAYFIISLGFESVCIVTNNTDILALGFYYSEKLAGKLYIEMLTNPKRIFNFSKIKLNKTLCEAMPGFHAVTGSDFINSFHRLGNTKGLNLERMIYFLMHSFYLVKDKLEGDENAITDSGSDDESTG